MPRPKRGDPEMLLVSFCDIVTITICAMFMAMIVVIDTASKIPVVSPVPILKPSTNAPVYFECRDNMVYPIDLAEITATFAKYATEFKKNAGSTDLEKLMSLDAGNKFYRIDPGLASLGILGLHSRPGVIGVTPEDLENAVKAAAADAKAAIEAAGSAGHGGGHGAPVKRVVSAAEAEQNAKNPFLATLKNMDSHSQYCVFFVRDSGFSIFRICRKFVVNKHYRHGWEYLASDEPITFEGMMVNPGHQ